MRTVWRDVLTNPFEPGHDVVPPVWAGRREELFDWSERVRPRRLAGQPERGRALLGEPGIGKSVLAAKVAEDAAARGDIVLPAVRIPRGSDVLALVADALLRSVHEHELGAEVGDRIAGLLSRVRSIAKLVEVDAARPPQNPHAQLFELLVEFGRYAAERDKVVLVRLDEVQNVTDEDALSQLLVAIGDALSHTVEVRDAAGTSHERALPIVVYLTGLSEFTEIATSAAGATFARRFAPTRLGHLDDEDLREALLPFISPTGWPVPGQPVGVTMTDGAIDRLLGSVLGDPFLFQLAGRSAWDAAPDEQVITAGHVSDGWERVKAEAVSHVERLVDRLPDREREFASAMAELPTGRRTLTRIAERLERRAANLGSAAQRLEERGVIIRGKPYRFNARTVEARLRDEWP